MPKKIEISKIFEERGWEEVWRGVSNNEISVKEAAEFAADQAKRLPGRPPLDPFWLCGAAVQKKYKITKETTGAVFFHWLTSHMDNAWDAERLGFEALYLLNTNLISWSAKVNVLDRESTLAEAVIEKVVKQDILKWHWDWSAVSNKWFDEFFFDKPERSAWICFLKMMEDGRANEPFNIDRQRLMSHVLKSSTTDDSKTTSMRGILKDSMEKWIREDELFRLKEMNKTPTLAANHKKKSV
jgi:hypothetical protein